MKRRMIWMGLLAAGLAMLAAAASACGGGGGEATATPPTGTAPAATPTLRTTVPASATPAASATPGAGGGAAGTTLTLIAKNTLFDKTSLTAPAGQITITFENQDSGIPHNLHVFQGTSASGQSMGMTPIATGPDTKSVTLNLSAGQYYYQCDVHPTLMFGTLQVQ